MPGSIIHYKRVHCTKVRGCRRRSKISRLDILETIDQLINTAFHRCIKADGDPMDEPARLPRSLAGVHYLILGNFCQISQRGRTVAETFLKWLICAKNASSSVTIAACSGTRSTEHRSLFISDVLDICSTLMIHDEAFDRSRFAHLSVRKFLELQLGYTPSEVNRSVLERLIHAL